MAHKGLIPALLFLLLPFAIFADGCLHIYDSETWHLSPEEMQYCFINHREGYQTMLLTIQLEGNLEGEQGVWIFPVPAAPEKSTIGRVRHFPRLRGYDVVEQARTAIDDSFDLVRLTQLYPLLFYFNKGKSAGGDLTDREGVTVYQSIEDSGMTTELISVSDPAALNRYVADKGLHLPDKSMAVLEEYIGKDYAFVITWISDLSRFGKENKHSRKNGTLPGVLIRFPSERIFFPLRPTSVYGSLKVPAMIYVLGHVTPELYTGIAESSEILYGRTREFLAAEELAPLLDGFELTPTRYQTPAGEETGYDLPSTPYTRLTLYPESRNLTADLWMDHTVPKQVTRAEALERLSLPIALGTLVLCSCLASLLSGLIFFRKSGLSPGRLLLLGLANLLTLIGFTAVSAWYLRKREKANPETPTDRPQASIKKILLTTAAAAAVFPVILSLSSLLLWGLGIIELLITLLLIPLFYALLFPFVYCLFRRKRILPFVAVFSILFMVLTLGCQMLLVLPFLGFPTP